MSDIIYTSANPGENVHSFYRRVLIEAYSTNQTVRGTFNDISVDVNPRSHLDDILIIWDLRSQANKKVKKKIKKPKKEHDFCTACWGIGEVKDGWGNFKHCFKCNGTGKKIKVCKWWGE